MLDLRVNPVRLVTETEYPAFARKAKIQELVSAGVVPQPPLPPIAFATPLPDTVMFVPRVSCVVMVRLVFTVVALFVIGAHVLLVLNPAVSQPANIALVDTPPPLPGLIVNTRVAVPAPPALEAVRLTREVPAEFGVPEITPVEEFTLRPAGKPVAPYDVGLPDAVIE